MLVLIVVSLVTLMTFVALAVDLGMLAVARTQCQDAADAAAMAGAGRSTATAANNNNYANADAQRAFGRHRQHGAFGHDPDRAR